MMLEHKMPVFSHISLWVVLFVYAMTIVAAFSGKAFGP